MSDMLDKALESMDSQLGIEPEETPPAASEPEGTAEPEVAEQPEGERDEQQTEEGEPGDPDVEAYLARFGGDQEKALKAAVEAQRMIGRQGQEYGELRKELEHLREAVGNQPAPSLAPQQQIVEWIDSQEDPRVAVQWAIQNDLNGPLYQRAMDNWHEVQPRAAAAFERQVEMNTLRQEMEARLTPVQQQTQQNAFAATWQKLRSEIPDLDQHRDQILQAAQETPEILLSLQTGDPAKAETVIRQLYKIASFDAKSATQAATTAVSQQVAAETAAAKKQAFVAAGSQRNEPEQKSPGDEWLEAMGFDKAAARYYDDES